MSNVSTLILDPVEELANRMIRLEDRLLWSDPEREQEAMILHAEAEAAAAISQAVTQAADQAPELYAPDGHHGLAPLLAVPGDLVALLAAIQRAVPLAAAQGPRLPNERQYRAEPLGTLDLLRCCVVSSRSACVEPIRDALSGATRKAVLTAEQYRSYRWFRTVVLTDALDRFAALGSPIPSLDHGHRLEHGAGL